MNKNRIKETKAYLQVGLIVGQVNIIENNIDKIIADYYTNKDREMSDTFLEDILKSGCIDLNNKIKLLKIIFDKYNIIPTKQFKNDIFDWRHKRNIVAHGLIGNVTNSDQIYIKNAKEFCELEKLRKDFANAQDRITIELDILKNKMTKTKSDGEN